MPTSTCAPIRPIFLAWTLRRVVRIVLLVFALPLSAAAQDLHTAAQQLARKIVVRVGPLARISFTLENNSSLPAVDVVAIRAAIEAELRTHGTRLVDLQESDVQVRVTLSENLQGLVWIAEVRKPGITEAAMVSVLRRDAPADAPQPEFMVIRREFLHAQEAPILDLVRLPGGEADEQRWLVLEPAQVVVYEVDGESWRALEMLRVTPAPSPHRDPRGRLEVWPAPEESVGPGVFTAFLPGVECGGTFEERVTMSCHESPSLESAWTLRLGPERVVNVHLPAGRNFFVRPPGEASALPEAAPPFFAVAALERENSPAWVFAASDGRARVFDAGGRPAGSFTGWGSEVAAVKSDCGSGSQILASAAVDWTQIDEVRAYQLDAGRPVAVSPPLEFPGPLTALWPAADASSALAVVRRRETGRYEAYSLTVICPR